MLNQLRLRVRFESKKQHNSHVELWTCYYLFLITNFIFISGRLTFLGHYHPATYELSMNCIYDTFFVEKFIAWNGI